MLHERKIVAVKNTEFGKNYKHLAGPPTKKRSRLNDAKRKRVNSHSTQYKKNIKCVFFMLKDNILCINDNVLCILYLKIYIYAYTIHTMHVKIRNGY